MTKKGILLLKTTTPEQIKILENIAPNYQFYDGFSKEPSNIPLDNVEIIYGWSALGNTVLQDPSCNLKWVQLHTAGVDYVDLNAMKEKNIILTNSSGIHGRVIAESVFGMLLSYIRGIGQSIKDQSLKKWRFPNHFMKLENSTMMIVGAGRIGVEVAQVAKAFHMKTIGVNRTGKAVEHMDVIIKQSEVRDYIPEADVVVNILPLTDQTTYFFNKSVFSRMKRSAVFINVGRGKSVNTKELIESLDEGKLAFAALDVFETEPLPEDSPLWEREDVLITPHISGLLPGYDDKAIAIFEENLKAFVEGKNMNNVINYEWNY